MTSYTPEKVNDRLNEIGRSFMRCISVNSYKRKDSEFTDDEFGNFVHSVKNVLTKNGQHPERTKRDRALRLPENSELKPLEEVETLLSTQNPAVSIVKKSYQGVTKYARFIDSEFGEFTAKTSSVLYKGTRHPDAIDRSSISRRAHTAAKRTWKDKGYESPFHSEVVQEKVRASIETKYGVRSIGSSSEIKKKIVSTNLERYGFGYLFQDPEFRQQCFEISVKNGRTNDSTEERELKEFLQSIDVYATKRRFWSEKREKYLEFDLVCEEKKIAFEMNGLYFHSERYLDKWYHYDKLELARSLGFRLIMIWDYEWNSRKRQVKNFVKSACGRNLQRIGARKCRLLKPDRETVKNFIEENHIQGYSNHIDAVGLYCDQELLMVATVSRHHRKNGVLVLNRMCGKDGVTVSGGFSRICKYLNKKYDVLYSWVDSRLSEGDSYQKSGWQLEEISKPDYFYTDHRKIISKQSRRKQSVGTPAEMTEKEHATLDGLIRVWDCGKKRLSYR